MDLQLRKYRRLAGLNQQQMADALDVKVATYRTWETERRNMSLPQAVACADLLGCTLDELAGRDVPRTYADPRQTTINLCFENMNERGRDTLESVAQSKERDTANRLVKNKLESLDGERAPRAARKVG